MMYKGKTTLFFLNNLKICFFKETCVIRAKRLVNKDEHVPREQKTFLRAFLFNFNDFLDVVKFFFVSCAKKTFFNLFNDFFFHSFFTGVFHSFKGKREGNGSFLCYKGTGGKLSLRLETKKATTLRFFFVVAKYFFRKTTYKRNKKLSREQHLFGEANC